MSPELQAVLNPLHDHWPLQRKILEKKRDFDELFAGPFNELLAVSYVLSPSLILEFVKGRGFSRAEIVVGEELVSDFKAELADKNVEEVRQLAELAKTGALRLFVPKRTIHSKLYLLKGPTLVRAIATSANLTETAKRATRQVNYAWYVDLPPGDPRIKEIQADYDAHVGECTLFMGDLLELLRDRSPDEADVVIRNWLSTTAEESEQGAKATIKAIEATVEASLEDRGIVTLALPMGPGRRVMERLFGPLPNGSSTEASLSVPDALQHLQQVVGLPYMKVDPGGVIVTVAGQARRRSSPLPSANEVSLALANLEDYCETAELGQCADPAMVKAAFLEVIMYALASPFFHQYMIAYRRTVGNFTMRGPRLLYVFGTSRNGKSTLLRFALKLLTGLPVNPLPGKEFKKTRISAARHTGTVFPLAFDDVPFASSSVEEIIKSYWEVWWSPNRPSPQIMITSNNPRLREWAQSRVKRVDLNVHFPPSLGHGERLSSLFEFNNRVFEWFSALYVQRWDGKITQEDELSLAREILLALYQHAGRPVPTYFPRMPIEKIYDPGREAWRDVIYGLGKARLHRVRERMRIDFAEDVPDQEVQAYQAYLPPSVSVNKTGRTLTVDNPKEFNVWLGPKRSAWKWWKKPRK